MGNKNVSLTGLTSAMADQIARLSYLLETRNTFSFLRMGDGELRFLIESQSSGRNDDAYAVETKSGLNSSLRGACAIRSSDYEKILRAYEEADFVDLHLHVSYNRENLPKLRWNRRLDGMETTGADDSQILLYWAWTCLKSYTCRHRCLICAAEAPLQEALLENDSYRALAGAIWPERVRVDFMRLPHDGRYLSRDFKIIEAALRDRIRNGGFDTLLLGASGLAKPLCVRLAGELNVRALDIGSLLRATTYSATSGVATWRANHNPFFFRVPLKVYMEATMTAYPELSPGKLVAKANAQLCLDLLRKRMGRSTRTFDSDSYELNPENIQAFNANLAYYRESLVPSLGDDPAVRHQVNDLQRWMDHRGLTWKGLLLGHFRAIVAPVRKVLSERLPS
jgi:hypothetical protein